MSRGWEKFVFINKLSVAICGRRDAARSEGPAERRRPGRLAGPVRCGDCQRTEAGLVHQTPFGLPAGGQTGQVPVRRRDRAAEGPRVQWGLYAGVRETDWLVWLRCDLHG